MRILFLLTILTALNTSGIAQSYYPLKAGNEWQLKFAGAFNPSGEAFMISKVLNEKVEIQGKSYFQIESTSYSKADDKGGFSNTSYARVDDDGNVYGFNSKEEKEETLMFPGNLSIGQTWKTAQGEMTVIDLDGTLETPEKSYTGCVIGEIENNGVKILSYVKEGIGVIGAKTNGQLMMYLSDYDLK